MSGCYFHTNNAMRRGMGLRELTWEEYNGGHTDRALEETPEGTRVGVFVKGEKVSEYFLPRPVFRNTWFTSERLEGFAWAWIIVLLVVFVAKVFSGTPH